MARSRLARWKHTHIHKNKYKTSLVRALLRPHAPEVLHGVVHQLRHPRLRVVLEVPQHPRSVLLPAESQTALVSQLRQAALRDGSSVTSVDIALAFDLGVFELSQERDGLQAERGRVRQAEDGRQRQILVHRR